MAEGQAERTCGAPSWPDPADPVTCSMLGGSDGWFVSACADPHTVSRLRMRCMSYWHRLNGLGIDFERRRSERIVILAAKGVAKNQPSTDALAS
jgi:hypothetical protein